MAYFDPATGFQTTQPPDWLKSVPTSAPALPSPGSQSNWLVAGLGSGFHGLLSDVGSFGQAVGTATGISPLAEAGKSFAQSQQDAATADQRPDLEQNPWSLSGIGYKVAQAVPSIVGMSLAGLAVPEAAVPAWLARVGEVAPGLLGGGRGLTGEALTAAGRSFGKGMIGAGAVALPSAVGGNVQAAEQGNDGAPLGQGQAVAALAAGVPEAAVAGLFPRSLASGGGGVGLGSRILRGALAGASVNAVNSGLQTGLEQFLGDPSTPIGDRAKAVVDSAMQGGVIGGILGGAFAPFHAPDKAPAQTSNEDMKDSTNFIMPPPPPPPAPGATYADMPSAQIQAMFAPLDAKGTSRSNAEGLQHVVLGDEIARRTVPGLTPGEGTLREPQDLAQLQPAIDALKARVIPDNANPNDPFVKTFNASSEPELVNSLQKRLSDISRLNAAGVKTATPDWLGNLADQYGVGRDGKSAPLLSQLADLTSQFDNSVRTVRAAIDAHDNDTLQAANNTANDLRVRISKLNTLIDTHNQAADLLKAARAPAGPAGLLGGPYTTFRDAPPDNSGLLTGPRNLLPPPESGEGFNSTPAPDEPPPAPGGAPLQLTDEAAIRRKTFQSSLLPDRQDSETRGVISTVNADSSPGLVNDLRGKMLQGELPPALRQLAEHVGLLDNEGKPRDLTAERSALYSDPDTAMRAQDDGSEINQVEKLQDLHSAAHRGAVEDVPTNIRQSYAPEWKALDEIGKTSNDSEIQKIVGDTKGLIESNAQNAGPAAQLALSSIDRIQRIPADFWAKALKQDAIRQSARDAQTAAALPEEITNPVPEKAFTTPVSKRGKNAVQKPSAKGIPVRERPEGGGQVPTRNAKERFTTRKSQRQEETSVEEKVADQEVPAQVTDPLERLSDVPHETLVHILNDFSSAPIQNLMKQSGLSKDRVHAALVAAVKRGERPEGGGQVPAQVTDPLEDRIREAHRAITGGEINGISQLRDIRDRLSDVPRETLDKKLAQLHEDPTSGIQVMDSSNGPDRTPDRLAGGFNYKGEQVHQMIANPRDLVETQNKLAEIAQEAAEPRDYSVLSVKELRRELKALQASSEDPAVKAEISTALKGAKKSGLIEALQRFGSSESGSLNLSAISKFFTPKERAEAEVQDGVRETNRFMSQLQQVGAGGVLNAKAGVRQFMLYGETGGNLEKINASQLPAGLEHRAATEIRQNFRGAIDKTFSSYAKSFFALKSQTRDLVGAMATRLQNAKVLDYRKSWEEHPELHNDPQAVQLQARLKELRSDASRLQQAGGLHVLEATLRNGQIQGYQSIIGRLTGPVSLLQKAGAVLSGHERPVEDTYTQHTQAHEDGSLVTARDFWAKEAANRIAGLDGHLADEDGRIQREALALHPGEDAAPEQILAAQEKIRKFVDTERAKTQDLRDLSDTLHRDTAETEKGLYAPLGRPGDFFASARLATNEDGTIREGAIEGLQKVLEKYKLEGVGLSREYDNSSFFSRHETREQMVRMAKALEEAKVAGHLDANTPIANGFPDEVQSFGRIGSAMFQKLMGMAHSIVADAPDGTPDWVKNGLLTAARQRYLDALPDNSLIKNLQHREFAQGYSTEFMRVMAMRNASSSRSVAQLVTSPRFAAAVQAMHDQVQAAKADPARAYADRTIPQEVANEIMRREAESTIYSGNPALSQVRSFVHTTNIGFNPAYVLTSTSQLLTTGHPELAKYAGYLKAAKFIASATPRALRILRTLDFPGVSPREDKMIAAGNISKRDIATIMRADNDGAISSATYTHMQTELGEGADPSKVKVYHWANVLGSSAEILPRIIMALATKDAYDANPKAFGKLSDREAVNSVVNNSQFKYGDATSSRMLGNRGFMGSFTPITMAFMNYHAKMTEKLYMEARDLISKDSSPETRKQAGMFLMSHLIATTALAGTLGLPFAASVASVADKLANTLTGKDDIDVEAMYRTWLAHTFGKDLGETIAKGVPRTALGFDLSHLGDQNLAPFKSVIDLITSKRKFEDAADDFLHSWSGSIFGDFEDWIEGSRDLFNGDYALGAQKILPEGLKGIAESYYLGEHGYIDKNGKVLPIKQSSLDILKKAMGLEPAKEAQYKEASKITAGLIDQRTYRQQNISTHLIRAIMTRDPASYQAWLGEAVKFKQDHPQLLGPAATLGRYMSRQMQQQGVSNALGLPPTVARDLSLRTNLGFLNSNQ